MFVQLKYVKLINFSFVTPFYFVFYAVQFSKLFCFTRLMYDYLPFYNFDFHFYAIQ